ncbi:MAG: gliding motility-associated lipoprotein GldB [Bacteroidia bacterium]|jgi:gliding motility-associated lipoprotein GldB
MRHNFLFRSLLFLLATSLLLASCSEDKREIPDVSLIQADLKVKRLDLEMEAFESKQDVVEFLNKYPKFSETYLDRRQYPHDSILVNQLYEFATYEFNDTLFMDTKRVFGDFSDVESEFEKAFQFVKYYYPNEKLPELYTVLTGFANFKFGKDISLNEEMIVLSLEYFAGKTATYRPPADQVPDYILNRYDKTYLVSMIMSFYSGKFNQSEFVDKTLLADMIYFGKMHYFTKQIMPNTADSLIIGYSGQEMANVDFNQKNIYGHFVEKNLFFEKSERIKNKYVGERPKTTEIADECPPRIGRWLGWEIVKSYMEENQDVTLQQLMANKNAQEIFQQSKYKPRK